MKLTNIVSILFDPFNMLGMRTSSWADQKYATFSRRLLAATLDLILMLLVAMVAEWIFEKFYKEVTVDWLKLWNDFHATNNPRVQTDILLRTLVYSGFLAWWWWDNVLQSIVLTVFIYVCWHYWSTTPGKMVLGMKIVDAKTEAPMSDSQIWWRLFGYAISTLFLLMGFFWIIVDKRRQGWHDKIAGTVVIRTSKSGSEAALPSDSPVPSGVG